MTHIEAFEKLVHERNRREHMRLYVKCFELDGFHPNTVMFILGLHYLYFSKLSNQPVPKTGLLTQIKSMVTIRKCNSYTFETAEQFVLNLPKN
jgi:hypothetical protein